MTGLRRFLPVTAALVLVLVLAPSAFSASKREVAASRYKHASSLYNDLKKVPRLELGKLQYELVISAFDAVPKIDPSSGYSDDALMAVGELYEVMADRFGDGSYRTKAVEAYAWAAREYPHSKHRDRAAAKVAELQGRSASPAVASSSRQTTPVGTTGARPRMTPALSDATHPAGSVIPPASGASSEKVAITKIRHHSYDDGTRVVLDIGGPAALKYDRLQRPSRLYVDVFGARVAASMIKGVEVEVGDSLLSTVRLAQNRSNKARLVFDLKRDVSFDAFWLDGPARLVLDLRESGAPRSPRTLQALEPERELPVAPQAAQKTTDGKHSLTRALGLKLGRVLIDPGHGGHDTGTIGQGGLQEKEVVLDISKRLGRLLEEQLGVEVILSRETDDFVALDERSKIANERGADLMISIHCNSAPSSRVRGIETYYLDFTTDDWALSVASSENAAGARTVHELEDMLSRIARNDSVEESREFARSVQSRLHAGVSRHSSSIKNRGVRKAPFVVLIDSKMPAVLVEIGFISNRSDEALLRKDSFRQEVAMHLFRGISEYARSLGALTQDRPAAATTASRD